MRYVLRLGDTSLVLGQRLGEWIGHAPALEEDLGLANLGARPDRAGAPAPHLCRRARGRGPRRGRARLSARRARVPATSRSPSSRTATSPTPSCASGCIDAWQLELYEAPARLERHAARGDRRQGAQGDALPLPLQQRLAGAPRRRHRGEPAQRAQRALDELWRFTDELFAADEVDKRMQAAGIAPRACGSSPRAGRRASMRTLRRRRCTAPRAQPLRLARQARRAHRAPRAHARGDAAPAAHLPGRPVVRSAAVSAGTANAWLESAEQRRLGAARERSGPRDPGAEHRRPRHRALRAHRGATSGCTSASRRPTPAARRPR